VVVEPTQDALPVRLELFLKETFDVLDEHGCGAQVANERESGGKQIAFVVCAQLLARE
jgi:hypothetical protein